MPNGIAVSNTGPLIAFAKIGRLGLLTEVFSEVLIPKTVSEELQASDTKSIGAEALTISGFRVVQCKGAADRLLQEIDGGEAAVIQVALETGAAEVLLDDKKARIDQRHQTVIRSDPAQWIFLKRAYC